jgi:hypothetical protein
VAPWIWALKAAILGFMYAAVGPPSEPNCRERGENTSRRGLQATDKALPSGVQPRCDTRTQLSRTRRTV